MNARLRGRAINRELLSLFSEESVTVLSVYRKIALATRVVLRTEVAGIHGAGRL